MVPEVIILTNDVMAINVITVTVVSRGGRFPSSSKTHLDHDAIVPYGDMVP